MNNKEISNLIGSNKAEKLFEDLGLADNVIEVLYTLCQGLLDTANDYMAGEEFGETYNFKKAWYMMKPYLTKYPLSGNNKFDGAVEKFAYALSIVQIREMAVSQLSDDNVYFEYLPTDFHQLVIDVTTTMGVLPKSDYDVRDTIKITKEMVQEGAW